MTRIATVAKTGTKTSARIISEFTRKIQSVGVVKNLRKTRYAERPNNKRGARVHKLNKLKKGAEIHSLIKAGKIVARAPRTTFKARPQTEAPAAAETSTTEAVAQ